MTYKKKICLEKSMITSTSNQQMKNLMLLMKKAKAKTGSLQGVYNLAGFITTASGQRMAFVQYLSGYAVEPADQRNRRIPLVRFESRLYKDIYQNN